MKPVKMILRAWIALTSLIAFLAGWVLLSHSGKPAQLFSVSPAQGQAGVIQPLPTLPPVPSLDQLTSGSGGTGSAIQPLPQLPQVSSRQFQPRMRTMGS